MKGTVGWLLGLGLLLLGGLSALLAVNEGVFTALSALGFLVGGVFSLPTLGPGLYRRIAGRPPQGNALVTVIFVAVSFAIGAAAWGA